ncbi:pilus assembly protein PilM [Algicola sagamiensis]|uniref:pilus assembly protein PilM n=1 Tax=Algicola sagamiensis TaxID=163869 RepID=UPI00058FB054|nr:pilus assembly protein PilM [Algicola sagamiensis]
MNVKELFGKKSTMMLGIDIGSHAIKAVQLSGSGSKYRLDAFAIEPLPKGAMNDREIQDIEAVGRAIQKIRRKFSRKITQAAAAVSGSSVITKIVFMDAGMREDEMESQIEIEADSLIPYPLNEISLDFEPLGPNPADPSKINVLLSAARTETVQTKVDALAGAQLEAKVIDVEGYALARGAEFCMSQLPSDASEKNIALIDVGANMMLFSIMQGGEVIYTRDQIFGGDQYTKSIASYYNQPYEDAEVAKLSGNLPPNYEMEVLAPFQTALVQQIRRAIQMFITSSGHEQVDYLMISGGTSCIAGLDKLLVEELGIHTIVANPFVEMGAASSVKKEELALKASNLVVATGLALRSFSSWHI